MIFSGKIFDRKICAIGRVKGDFMLRPRTLNKEVLKECRNDYDKLTENGDFDDFKIMIMHAWIWGENIAVDFTREKFSEIAKEIYDNTDFKEYKKQKYYIKQYFTAVCLEKLKEKILRGEITPNERYADLLYGSKNVKINWFDKIKLRLTLANFFNYLKAKYYYFWSEKDIVHTYGKEYDFLEKFLFFNKYRAFAVMQDYRYVAKRIAKHDFSDIIMLKNPPSAHSANSMYLRYLRKLKLMPVFILVLSIMYTILHYIYFKR